MARTGWSNPAPTDDWLRSSETIQGNVLAPFNKPVQGFLFLNFNNDRDGARLWLAELTAGDRIASTRAVVEHGEQRRIEMSAGREPPKKV
jgi:hypothetical protein